MCTSEVDSLGPFRLRGNIPLLFLLFFGTTTVLAGGMYEAYQLYVSSSGAGTYAALVGATAFGFVFSLLISARIMYKAAA